MFGLDQRIALIILSVWLIATGLLSVAGIGLSGSGLTLSVLSIAAGVLILVQGDSWAPRTGMLLLGAWLLLTGLLTVVNVRI